MSKPVKRPSPVSVLMYLVLIGLGVMRLRSPHALTTGSLVWAWGLILWGGLGVLLALLARVMHVSTPEESAQTLLEQQKKLYGGSHEFRRVGPEAFEGLDTEFYESNRTRLEKLGFHYVADVEDVTVANTWPRHQSVLRVMLGDGGAVTGTIFHLRLFGVARGLQFIGVLPRKLLTVEFETELSDGSFVCTSNTLKSDTTAPFPRISKLRLPAATPPEQLLDQHREHLRTALATAPGVRPLAFYSLEDVLESQNRQQMIKSAHKARIGYLDENELKSVLQKPELGRSEKQVLAHVRELQRADEGAAPPPLPRDGAPRSLS